MPDELYEIKTIAASVTGEFRDRGSRFIAYAFPLRTAEEFKVQLKLLKKEHPKAVHHCFAYRLGADGNNFRVSDDGEPSGTAGRPILGQIDSRHLSNTGIVVVRYFGGTLLGVPGLIHAYKTAAAQALESAVVLQEPVRILYCLAFDYTQLNEVMRWVKQFHCTVLKQELQLFCSMEIGIPKRELDALLEKLKDTPGVGIKPC